MLQTLPLCSFREEGCYLILTDVDDQVLCSMVWDSEVSSFASHQTELHWFLPPDSYHRKWYVLSKVIHDTDLSTQIIHGTELSIHRAALLHARLQVRTAWPLKGLASPRFDTAFSTHQGLGTSGYLLSLYSERLEMKHSLKKKKRAEHISLSLPLQLPVPNRQLWYGAGDQVVLVRTLRC